MEIIIHHVMSYQCHITKQLKSGFFGKNDIFPFWFARSLAAAVNIGIEVGKQTR
jgi:hypothetical protein